MSAINEEVLTEYFGYSHAREEKWSDDEIDPFLEELAKLYAESYKGEFEFLDNMQEKVEKGYKLSIPQVRGIVNCMAAQVRIGFIPDYKIGRASCRERV